MTVAMDIQYSSRIHERTISLRFLGIILRDLRLGKEVWFSIRFPPFSFTMYSKFTVEICKRLREFEEIEISRQNCRGDCE
jgi:hypothetical protein